ncbi:MAG: alanine racemase, partial [Paludibacteraceae bacterium]|nr:alanine racemase [Paludibacteraceae bacterium]
MRIEVESGINGCLIVKDSYNQDLKSLTNHSLAFLEQQIDEKMPRTLILYADNQNCNAEIPTLVSEVQSAFERKQLHRIVLIGECLAQYSYQFPERDRLVFSDINLFLTSNFFEKIQNEAILLKIASEKEEKLVLQRLRLLVHDTVLETNFDALKYNINHFRKKLQPETKLMCMVKASAYGSGSIEVSRALQYWGCDYLAVAFAHEGVELRQAGIDIPIMVLDPCVDVLGRMIENKLEPEIFSFSMLQTMLQEAEQRNLKDYPIHLKIDSGMHRAGFELDDLDEVLEMLQQQSYLKVVSVFSHLVGADDSQFDSFTQWQIDYFSTCAKKIVSAFPHKVLCHILNSSGSQRFTENHFDMIRLGIGLWGISFSEKDVLQNVCTLKTKVSQIKYVDKSETVGYSRKGVLTQNSKIALLPLGYADGIDRRLGNGAWNVLIGEQSFPIIGNVCMDLMMVDVTGSNVKEGDEVTIFGDKQTIADMSAVLGTIPYEVLTSIAPRVRRVYFCK